MPRTHFSTQINLLIASGEYEFFSPSNGSQIRNIMLPEIVKRTWKFYTSESPIEEGRTLRKMRQLAGNSRCLRHTINPALRRSIFNSKWFFRNLWKINERLLEWLESSWFTINMLKLVPLRLSHPNTNVWDFI